jgi:hypothetical protein
MNEQRLQDYIRLIDQFLNPPSNRGTDQILSAHADLVDQGLLIAIAEAIDVLQAKGKATKAEGLQNLLDELTERVEAALVREPSLNVRAKTA